MQNTSIRPLRISAIPLAPVAPVPSAQTDAPATERLTLSADGKSDIALQVQRPATGSARADVVYVHGGTFGADLSIYFRFDGRSWADQLTDEGFIVWGFD